MHRIQRVSKVVKLVAHALSVVCLISAVLIAITGFTKLFEYAALQVITLHTSALSLVLMVVFHKLARLAERYEHGELFEAANVRHLRAIGWLTLLTAVSTGLNYDKAIADFEVLVEVNAGPIVAGFLFIFMSWVMDEARKLDEEHGLTI